MKKFVLKNSETRFQNAKTPLSPIFLARTWMDSAQKSLLGGKFFFARYNLLRRLVIFKYLFDALATLSIEILAKFAKFRANFAKLCHFYLAKI